MQNVTQLIQFKAKQGNISIENILVAQTCTSEHCGGGGWGGSLKFSN